MVLALAACGGSKDDSEPTTTAGTAAGTTAVGTASGTPTGTVAGASTGTPTGTTTPASCELTGTWEVETVLCGTFDSTTDYLSRYGSTQLVVDAACEAELVLTSGGCVEVEAVTVASALTGGELTLDRTGITSCAPVDCPSPAGDTCTVGQHAFGSQAHPATRLAPDALELTGFIANHYPQCTLDFITRWQRL